MNKKMTIIIILVLVVVIIFQQMNIIDARKKAGKFIYSNIHSLHSDVQFSRNKILNTKDRISTGAMDRINDNFTYQNVKILTIYTHVIYILDDINRLERTTNDEEYLKLKESLLIKLEDLLEALDTIEEDCKDEPINYYYLKYEDNNSTMEKVKQILNYNKRK